MMTDKNLIADAAEKLFKDFLTTELRNKVYAGEWPATVWDKLLETGLVEAAVSETRGGTGLDISECCAIAKACGKYAAPVPLVEAYLAERTLAAAGLPPASGLTGIALPVRGNSLKLKRSGGKAALTGSLKQVPWGRNLMNVVAIADEDGQPVTVLIQGPFKDVIRSENAAGEPRDTIRLSDHALPASQAGAKGSGLKPHELRAAGALYRCAQMTGAMQTALDMATTYVKQREQFGRPIAKFQAVQQQIAQMASEIVASDGVVSAAIEAAGSGLGLFQIAAAKSRLGKAADMTVDVAHQVHGAIGTTRDYPLHLYTMRVASWRDECGSPNEWSEWIGRLVCRTGGDALWPELTSGFTSVSQ